LPTELEKLQKNKGTLKQRKHHKKKRPPGDGTENRRPKAKHGCKTKNDASVECLKNRRVVMLKKSSKRPLGEQEQQGGITQHPRGGNNIYTTPGGGGRPSKPFKTTKTIEKGRRREGKVKTKLGADVSRGMREKTHQF